MLSHDRDRAAPGRPRVPWGLVATLGLVALAELFVSQSTLRFMNAAELDWMSSGQATAKVGNRFDILCFGDSMLKFGIAPRVLEAKRGRTVYNLALLDGKPVLTYLLFRRAIEAGARPSAVIVDFSPEGLNQAPWHLLLNPHWNALLANPREAWELAWNYHDGEWFGHLVAARVLPSFRCRTQIRANVQAAFQGQSGPNTENNRPLVRNRKVNRGGIVLAKQPGFQGEVPQQCVGDLLNPEFVVRPAHARPVRKLLQLAAEHNITVYCLLMPNSARVIAARDASGVHARYDQFLHGLMAQFPNLSVIDARHAAYQDAVFVDPVHLDRDGAAALSGDVADVLDSALSQSEPVERWVDLPAYRDRPVAVRLEDVDQSRSALQQRPETRLR
jgi:hypothetical protein